MCHLKFWKPPTSQSQPLSSLNDCSEPKAQLKHMKQPFGAFVIKPRTRLPSDLLISSILVFNHFIAPYNVAIDPDPCNIMKAIPLEIHIVIIEWVYRSSQHAAIDYPTLRACALVCRAWTPIAQHLLFRRAPVPKVENHDSVDIMARFAHTLRTAPHLAAHVRSLYLELPALEHIPGVAENTLEVLVLCRNIDGITIFLLSADPSCAALIARFHTLPVRPVYLNVCGTASHVDHVIHIWPSVRVLDFGLVTGSDMHVRMPRQLQALSTGSWNMKIYWSVPTAVAPGLHDLELGCHQEAWSPVLAALVSSGVAAQLRSLCLFCYGARIELPPLAVLKTLVALETLVIDSLPMESCILPKNLRHFGYHSYITEERSEQVQILLDAVRALPKLNLFTATRRSSQETLQEIKRLCRDGGVEFAVYPEPGHFRTEFGSYIMVATPLDIHIAVIEWVYRSSQHAAVDYPTLRACAVVCRAWTPIAQRLLFRRAPFPKASSLDHDSIVIDRFTRTLRTAPHLAAHVRHLCLTRLRRDHSSGADNAIEALKLCRDVDGITFFPLVTDEAELIPRLKHLPMRPIFLSVLGNDDVIDDILQVWPSVRVVDIGVVFGSYVQVRMPHGLQTLSISSSTLSKCWSEPAGVAPGLQDLDLYCYGGVFSNTLAELVSSGVAAQLRSLCLSGEGAEVPSPAVLEELAALESFVLTRLPTKACGLPRNLRHFGYHFPGTHQERSENEHILLDAARTLPKLNLFTATRQSSQAVLEEIERRCRDCVVDFVVYPEPGCFRVGGQFGQHTMSG
ncbi:hypothetical protein FA95DRAFT_1596766 [Auriscalpium vulgare]|uniref:Uncharacterized protein n=1 Tax=Auriscalpium vulgare TaxID=40419 RepID=A0ACB8RPE2_9AGAM|nr:hypothetical protein FA95DRAFT_1596766 [Auriscalpium vulgare]